MEGDGSLLEEAIEHREVLAHVLGRLVERQPEDALDHELVREPDAEYEPTAGGGLRAHRLLRHIEGMSRVGGHHGGAELDARHLATRDGDRRHRVESEDVCEPCRVKARLLGRLCVRDDLVDRRPTNADRHSHGANRRRTSSVAHWPPSRR